MTPVFRIAAVLAGLVAGLATAAAQPTQPAPPPTGGAPAPAVMRPPPNEPPPPAPVEDPAMATYREGYAALVAGDFTTARAKLGVVAETAVDPELRGAARELARLADELGARQARLVFGAAALHDDGAEDPADGRTSFVATTTLASLYAGVVLIDITDTDSVRSGAALILGATAAGFR